jgi:hypothetical protein
VPQPSGRQPAANAAGRESGHERFVRLKKEIHTQLVTGPRMPAVNAVNDYELRQELRRGVEQICQGRGDQALKELGAAFRKDSARRTSSVVMAARNSQSSCPNRMPRPRTRSPSDCDPPQNARFSRGFPCCRHRSR